MIRHVEQELRVAVRRRRLPSRRLSRVIPVMIVWLLLAVGCTSVEDPAGPGGLSTEGLKAVTAALQEAVDRGDVGGIVSLIFRHGEIAQVDAVGWQDEAGATPMARDSIFRIASMTKPITSVAALILLDEGKLRLEDPVERWLPELSEPKVLRDPTDPLGLRSSGDASDPGRRSAHPPIGYRHPADPTRPPAGRVDGGRCEQLDGP